MWLSYKGASHLMKQQSLKIVINLLPHKLLWQFLAASLLVLLVFPLPLVLVLTASLQTPWVWRFSDDQNKADKCHRLPLPLLLCCYRPSHRGASHEVWLVGWHSLQRRVNHEHQIWRKIIPPSYKSYWKFIEWSYSWLNARLVVMETFRAVSINYL